MIGFGCARPTDGNDIHLFKDLIAVIQHPREVPGSEITVDAFHVPSLLPTSPKLMLNAEIDDYGIIDHRPCGCLLESYGFTEHIRQIHSFRKLTTEGWTLIGSDMVRILEEVLPARFGGSALDYQFMEEEDDRGFTRLSLIVSPKVPIANEATVIQVVLQAMQDAPRAIYRRAGTLRVRRMDPIWTPRDKFLPLLPLHLARHASLVTDSGDARKPT